MKMPFILLIIIMFLFIPYITFGKQQIIFQENFNGHDSLKKWHGRDGLLLQEAGSNYLLTFVNNDSRKTLLRSLSLPLEHLAGRLATFEASIAATCVGHPPNPWNGIKVMLVLTKRNGLKEHVQLAIPNGSFPSTTYSKSIIMPENLNKVQLILGLELTTGNITIDDIVLSIRIPKQRKKLKYGYGTFDIHTSKRLRGIMYGPEYQHDDIEELAKWNVNVIRWQLKPVHPAKKNMRKYWDMGLYDSFLDEALVHLDKALPQLQSLGIKVLIDLHFAPGGRDRKNSCRLFNSREYQDKLIQVWHKIAKRYMGNTNIYAYDLLNEPNEQDDPHLKINKWRHIAITIISIIRNIDPSRAIVYQLDVKGRNSFNREEPLPFANIAYSFHMYEPMAYTHQEIPGSGHYNSYTYPGHIMGYHWNKAELQNFLLPVRQFQQDFGVPIIVGEFSAVRWAPGADRYLSDLINIFQKFNWHWIYHSFRLFNGWSVEHNNIHEDIDPVQYTTQRKKILLKWYTKNQRLISKQQ